MRRGLPGLRDKEAGGPAQDGKEHQDDGEHGRIAAVLHREAARDGAAEDRQKGGALDKGIARRQFFPRQMIGKDAVLDRPEQSSDHAEQEQGHEQQWQRVQLETGHGDGRRADFRELQQARYQGLVEAICEFAACGRQQKKWRDENAACQRHQRFPSRAADLEEDQQDECILQKVVVEGREELAPEQGRKAPGGEE